MRLEIHDIDIFKKLPVEAFFDPIFNPLEVEFHWCNSDKYLSKVVIEIKCIDFSGEYYKEYFNGALVKLVKLYVLDYETNDYVLKKAWSDIKEWEHPLPDRVLKDLYPDFFTNQSDLLTYYWNEVEEFMDVSLEERRKKVDDDAVDLPL